MSTLTNAELDQRHYVTRCAEMSALARCACLKAELVTAPQGPGRAFIEASLAEWKGITLRCARELNRLARLKHGGAA